MTMCTLVERAQLRNAALAKDDGTGTNDAGG